MNKERVRKSRENKLDRAANGWQYNRFGVDEKPTQPTPTKQSTVLFDEAQMRRGWTNNRFGVEEE